MTWTALLLGYEGPKGKIGRSTDELSGYLQALEDQGIISKHVLHPLFSKDDVAKCDAYFQTKGFQELPDTVKELLKLNVIEEKPSFEEAGLSKKEAYDQFERYTELRNAGLVPERLLIATVAKIGKNQKNELIRKSVFLEERFGLELKVFRSE